MLPAFGRMHPSAADIRNEHAQIRDALIELGVDVDLHAARADMVARFVALLRRHAAREEALTSRWSEEHLEPHVRSTILERLLGRLKMTPAGSTTWARSALANDVSPGVLGSMPWSSPT